MINPFEFMDALRSHDINFATGVPDSLLKELLKALDNSWEQESNVIAANEGSAIAIAAGHYISSGAPALVYMQNSGLGNAVNPLLSLADSEVYGIPMLLVIGWRGEPGTSDEPQHIKQGRISEDLLRIMEIPTFKVGAEAEVDKILNEAVSIMLKGSQPVALLVSKDTFEPVNSTIQQNEYFQLSREKAIEVIVENLPKDSLIVSTTGMASRELFEIRKKKGETHKFDFLTVGSMGHASSIAFGIAKNVPSRSVVCLDGDGSYLMHMGSNGIIAQSGKNNYLHILINNGAHDSVGGQPTIGLKLDMQKLSKEMGYVNTDTCDSESKLIEQIRKLSALDGPNFLEVKVKKGARKNLGRPTSSPKENLKDFMENIIYG